MHSPRFLILKNQTTAEYQGLPHENQIKWPGVHCSEGAPDSFIWSHKDASIAINAVLDFSVLKNGETRCIHRLLRQCPIPYESAPFEIELEHPKRIVAAELNNHERDALAYADFSSRQTAYSHIGRKQSSSSTRCGLKP